MWSGPWCNTKHKHRVRVSSTLFTVLPRLEINRQHWAASWTLKLLLSPGNIKSLLLPLKVKGIYINNMSYSKKILKLLRSSFHLSTYPSILQEMITVNQVFRLWCKEPLNYNTVFWEQGIETKVLNRCIGFEELTDEKCRLHLLVKRDQLIMSRLTHPLLQHRRYHHIYLRS